MKETASGKESVLFSQTGEGHNFEKGFSEKFYGTFIAAVRKCQ